MDPYSAEGELVHIHSAFHQAQFQKVADFDISSFSRENQLPARILKLRACIALGQYDQVLKEVKGQESTPDFAAIAVLAEYRKRKNTDATAVVEKAKELAKARGDNLNVELCCGTVLADAGLTEEALAVLAKHQGSLDAVALIVQIHLQQNRLDLASKEATNARKWAQDSLLVNIAESWVGMREGGDKYQAAYYVFEELAQTPSSQSTHNLVSQALAELHLGRLPEAEAALQQAMQLDPESEDVVANLAVLHTILGKDTKEQLDALRRINPNHTLLAGLEEKKQEFGKALEKYNPKIIEP